MTTKMKVIDDLYNLRCILNNFENNVDSLEHYSILDNTWVDNNDQRLERLDEWLRRLKEDWDEYKQSKGFDVSSSENTGGCERSTKREDREKNTT